MKKVIVLRGLPGSGKSTLAEAMVSSGGNFARVNRDLIRQMLHFGKWTGKNEGDTIDAEKACVLALLERGKSVIVDDTNLGDKHVQMWKDVVNEYNEYFDESVVVELNKVNTDIDVCIERDSRRQIPVGKNRIIEMALEYGMYPKPKLPIVICDIDGTVADLTHRRHFVEVKEGEKKDWKSFFGNVLRDSVIVSVVDSVKEYHNKGHEIFFVSGRPDSIRMETEGWLSQNIPFEYSALLMRRNTDKREDTDVKRDIYNKYLSNLPIEVVFDDRPRIIRMWKENGLKVIECGDGTEF